MDRRRHGRARPAWAVPRCRSTTVSSCRRSTTGSPARRWSRPSRRLLARERPVSRIYQVFQQAKVKMSYTVVVVVVVMVVCIDLWEIDKKKQCRAELTELERREHLLRRKELYEKKWPPSGRERSEEHTSELQS